MGWRGEGHGGEDHIYRGRAGKAGVADVGGPAKRVAAEGY